jgi:phage terminase large subunit-like protein
MADRLFRYFKTVLRLNGGKFEGKPFNLEPSQCFITGSIFGWYREDGSRRFRIAYIEEAKGSGKTPMAGGIGHYMGTADGEARAEVYSIATNREQATILFRDAVAMARLSPALLSRVTFSGGEGREFNMAYLATASFFRPISSESSGRGKSGFRPHCGLVDELHEHPTPAMLEFVIANIKWRAQPLIFAITNSGFDRSSVGWQYHEYGRKIAAGEIADDAFFSYICALDEGEDPFGAEDDPDLGFPRCWLKVNPLLGVTIQPAYLKTQVRQARQMPAKESTVRRLNFCQWVDAANPWIDGDLWRACEVDELPEAADAESFLALDLSQSRDLTAAARVYRDVEGGLSAELRFWTPEDTLEERERKDQAPYSAWVSAGHLNAVPGRSVDYGFVVRDIGEWLAEARSLAFDQWRIDDFLRALDAAGIDAWIRESEEQTGAGVMLVRHGQGFSGGAHPTTVWMPRSVTSLESRILNRTIRVKRNPVLTWNSASAVLAEDPAGNKKWEKRKSTGRIDGIVALCMAVGLADSVQETELGSWLLFSTGDLE